MGPGIDSKSTFCDSVTVMGVGIAKPDPIAQIKVWPNPVKDQVNLELPDGMNGTAILWNALGQPMTLGDVRGGVQVIPVNQWSAGVYLLEIRSENKSKHFRLLVE